MIHTAPFTLGLQLTEVDFCAWIGQAAPQDVIEYHRGFLIVDIDRRLSALSRADRRRLSNVASRAWQCAEDGLVHLVQRRLGANRFSYLAIARPRPETPALSSLLLAEAA